MTRTVGPAVAMAHGAKAHSTLASARNGVATLKGGRIDGRWLRASGLRVANIAAQTAALAAAPKVLELVVSHISPSLALTSSSRALPPTPSSRQTGPEPGSALVLVIYVVYVVLFGLMLLLRRVWLSRSVRDTTMSPASPPPSPLVVAEPDSTSPIGSASPTSVACVFESTVNAAEESVSPGHLRCEARNFWREHSKTSCGPPPSPAAALGCGTLAHTPGRGSSTDGAKMAKVCLDDAEDALWDGGCSTGRGRRISPHHVRRPRNEPRIPPALVNAVTAYTRSTQLSWVMEAARGVELSSPIHSPLGSPASTPAQTPTASPQRIPAPRPDESTEGHVGVTPSVERTPTAFDVVGDVASSANRPLHATLDGSAMRRDITTPKKPRRRNSSLAPRESSARFYHTK